MNTPLTPDEIDRLAQRRAGAKLGWFIHATVYLAVNAVFWLLALQGSTGGRPWSLYPTLGWGLGLLLHGASVWLFGTGSGIRERMVEKERERLRQRRS